MKQTKQDRSSQLAPWLQSLTKELEGSPKIDKARVDAKPLEPADLYQDDGGGFNSNFTQPQR